MLNSSIRALPEVFGQALAIYPWMTFGKIKTGKINFQFSAGTGLALVTKKYDLIDNHENLIIGSRLNNATMFSLRMKKTLAARWSANLGITVLHISNARFALPNIRLNIPMVYLHLSHAVKPSPKPVINSTENDYARNDFIVSRAGFGMTEMNSPDGPDYAIWSSAIGVGVRWNLIHQFTLSGGFTFLESAHAYIKTHELFTDRYFLHFTKTHVQVAYEMFFSH